MKLLKTTLVSVAAVLGVVAPYYAVVVIKARMDTPEIAQAALSSEIVKIKYNDLSEWQMKTLLTIQDPSFFQHKGIDYKTPGGGLTTISQAVVKKLYFNPFKPGIAKIKQSLIARFAFDPLVSKNDQLTLFINYMYLGEADRKDVIGFDNAARAYYNKSVKELTEDEYLSIVAMIIAPVNFHVRNHPEENRTRVERMKKVISGEYNPKNLMDIYYGPLDEKTQEGLAPASYFSSIYK